LTSRFTGITAAVNDVEAAAVDRGAFNEAHLPSLVVARHSAAFVGAGVGGTHVYNEVQALFPAYATIDTNGGAGGGTDLQINFAPAINLVGGETSGILIMLDLLVQSLQDDSGNNSVDRRMSYRLQADGGGGFATIPRSERFLNEGIAAAPGLWNGTNQYVHVSLRLLIRSGDTPTNLVNSVRAQVSVTAAAGALVEELTLTNVALAGLALHSSRATP
jgi:hypothetical protein